MEIKEYTFSISEALVPLLGAIIAALGYIISKRNKEIETIKNQLSDKKYSSYHETYAIIFDVLKSSKKLFKMKEVELIRRIMDVRKDLYIYAPTI